MTPALATAGAPALWYLSRGSGAVALILLSTSVVLGIVDQRRWYDSRWPRFALHSLHWWVSLFAVSFLAVHILSAVLDSFAPIRLVDAFIPFAGKYRPLWLGFGALALDMLLAVTITSLVRRRIGQRAWRAVHWLSYAAWPVAVVHGLGTGSDVRAGWLLAITAACVAAVWIAVFVRVWDAAPRARTASLGALAALPIAAIIWLPQGPLAKGWARRAGTPPRLLAVSSVTKPAARQDLFPVPFSAYLGGSETDSRSDAGNARVDLAMHLTGGARGAAEVVLEGQPLPTGGLSVETSRVTLGPSSDPTRYQGRVISLENSDVVAEVSDQAGKALRADFRLVLEGGRVQGTVSVVQE